MFDPEKIKSLLKDGLIDTISGAAKEIFTSSELGNDVEKTIKEILKQEGIPYNLLTLKTLLEGIKCFMALQEKPNGPDSSPPMTPHQILTISFLIWKISEKEKEMKDKINETL